MLTTSYTYDSKLRRLRSVIITTSWATLIQLLCCKWTDTAFCLCTLVSWVHRSKLFGGGRAIAVNSFAGGAPVLFVTEPGSCVLNEAEHFKKGKDDFKTNTAEWSILGPNKAHSSPNKVFQSSHVASARFFVVCISYFCSAYTGTLIWCSHTSPPRSTKEGPRS